MSEPEETPITTEKKEEEPAPLVEEAKLEEIIQPETEEIDPDAEVSVHATMEKAIENYRKIKEAILAFRIERALSKERILELYLNQIYLGEGSYGIASASLEYFDKPINELTYEEAALLAALPKAPSKYNPYKNIKLAKFRRDLVLKNLFDNNYLSKDKYSQLIQKKIILKKLIIKKKILLKY